MPGALDVVCDPGKAGPGPELLEPLSRRVNLEAAPVLIAAAFTHRGHQEAGLGLLVGRLQIPPHFRRLAQRRRRISKVTFGEAYRTGRLRRRREEQRRANAAGDLRQFGGGSPRVLDITGGNQDVDGSGEHSGASGTNPRVEQHSPNRGR
jgi:hypothetical protein